MMWPEIVENDDVAVVQTTAESLPNEVNELRAVDRTDEGLMTHDAVDSNGADDREILAQLMGL